MKKMISKNKNQDLINQKFNWQRVIKKFEIILEYMKIMTNHKYRLIKYIKKKMHIDQLQICQNN